MNTNPAPARLFSIGLDVSDVAEAIDLVDAHAMPSRALAALCIGHGPAIASADSDFARSSDLRWISPGTAA